MKYVYIVAAAGIGKRVGLNYPKQFFEFAGKPVFIHTLQKIDANEYVDEIIVVTKKEDIGKVSDCCKKFNISKLTQVVEGGKERQDSIYNALKHVYEDSIIGVQDGVRPFIEDRYITHSYKELMDNSKIDGVVVAVPTKDTIKIVGKDDIIESTPIRKKLYFAQTPQVFRGRILKKAYDLASQEGYIGTDDSSLVERIGKKVKIIKGSYENFKITTPEDLKKLVTV